jgi:hypothetical protein
MNIIKGSFAIATLLISFSFQLFAQDNYLDYYKTSYVESRHTFREYANEIHNTYPESKTFSITVPSKIDRDLTVDMLYIPCSTDKDKIMIISSGVHGVEGFVGSAVQNMFIDTFLNKELLSKTGLLMIHSVNPYGYKYQRRVSENNVDLNRNSTNDPVLYSTVNEGYPKVYDFINPKGKVNTRSLGNKMFKIRAVFKILKASMPVLRQAVLQGQYQFPEGLYYGGNGFEPQIKDLAPVIDSICEPYKTVFTLDLHTGYGETGKLHLFPNPVDEKTRKNMENIFAGYQIDWGDSDDFYTVTGDFVDFTGKLNNDKNFIPMTFEYGTMDSQTTGGSLKSIHIMILENQGNHYGYKKERDSLKVKHDILEMYFPSDNEWRIKIIKDTREILKVILPRFLETDY